MGKVDKCIIQILREKERFDGQENSSEIQPPTQSKKPQAALKTATATDSEKLFREGWQQGMIELMKK